MPETIKDSELALACIHVIKDPSKVHSRTTEHSLCKACFDKFEAYGHDKKGNWKLPKDIDLSEIKTVCKGCLPKKP